MDEQNINGMPLDMTPDPEEWLGIVQETLPELVEKLHDYAKTAVWTTEEDRDELADLVDRVEKLNALAGDREALREAVLVSDLPVFFDSFLEHASEDADVFEEEASTVAGGIGIVQAYS